MQGEDATKSFLLSNYPQVRYIKQKSKGKGNAMKEAAKAAKGEYLLFMDGDGSMSPKEIPNFTHAIFDNDYFFIRGSRMMENGGSEDLTKFRMFGNWFFTKLTNFLFRGNYTDLCYGYFAIKKEVFLEMELKSDHFSIEAEVSALALKENIPLCEIPSFEKHRIHGASNLSALKDGWGILKTILSVFFRKKHKPSIPHGQKK